MAIDFALNYLLNKPFGNSKFFCEALHRVGKRWAMMAESLSVGISDFINLNFSKLPWSSFFIVPIFVDAISLVIERISEKKMVWIYAQWSVAFMANVLIFWNGSSSQNPRKTMCSNCLSVQLNLPISTSFRRFPEPTRTGFFNFIPKSNSHYHRKETV